MLIQDLDISHYDTTTQYYLRLVPEGELIQLLTESGRATQKFFGDIPDKKHEFRYAPDKWTVKDVLQHLIDVERIFTFRALSFARGESQALPGFDVEAYGKRQRTEGRPYHELLREYGLLRETTVLLFAGFDAEALDEAGVASGFPVSVGQLGFKLVGHERHHQSVVKERY